MNHNASIRYGTRRRCDPQVESLCEDGQAGMESEQESRAFSEHERKLDVGVLIRLDNFFNFLFFSIELLYLEITNSELEYFRQFS